MFHVVKNRFRHRKCRYKGLAKNTAQRQVLFATEWGIALGQEKVASKSNEITALPELLNALSINGLLVTIDALGCQKSLARQITDQGVTTC